ncbi:hypothetical protein [Microbacterium sp. Mcb102]|uniref:hypothetical protein n=1 Tax=Microbacterium sp. Mcb102 TaxID=2926012 RepID=UPI0021C9FF25|nr:hypothetical protein [Microbacterium sp. Mcb102]
MAIGDTAAQAGLPLASGGNQASDIDTLINETRDMVGMLMLSLPRRISVGATAPSSPQVGDVWIRTGA